MGDNIGAVFFEVSCYAHIEIRYHCPLTHEYSNSLVTHETSYLPFVLSCTDASGSSTQPAKLRGRRTWNKRGQEVTEVEVRAHI